MKCVRIAVSGFTGETFTNRLKAYGSDNWGFDFIEGNYLDKYSPKQLVYLTADAEEEL